MKLVGNIGLAANVATHPSGSITYRCPPRGDTKSRRGTVTARQPPFPEVVGAVRWVRKMFCTGSRRRVLGAPMQFRRDAMLPAYRPNSRRPQRSTAVESTRDIHSRPRGSREAAQSVEIAYLSVAASFRSAACRGGANGGRRSQPSLWWRACRWRQRCWSGVALLGAHRVVYAAPTWWCGRWPAWARRGRGGRRCATCAMLPNRHRHR